MKLNKHGHWGYASGLVLVMLVLATAAEAKTRYVDTAGKGDFRTLAAAVAAAGNGDVIVLAPGVHAGATDTSGKALTIRSQDPNDPKVVADTVIDCGLEGGYFLSDTVGDSVVDNTPVTVAGLTVRKSPRGAILADGAELILINCVFTGNAADWGGAINCAGSHIRLTACAFQGNASGANGGGAIFCSVSRLDFTDCTFQDNKGCAVVNCDSLLNFTDCQFQNNSGEDGGVIHCRRDAPHGVAPGLNLRRCTFLGNSASASGGAIYSYYVPATFDACTFTSNQSKQDGGAIYHSGATVALKNCVFLRNSANLTGGALSTWYGSNPQLLNCTLVANTAATGGAVAANGGSLASISHCILWNNTAGQGKNVALVPNIFDYTGIATATIEYSDLAGGQDDILVTPTSVLNWSVGNLDANPLFLSSHDYSLSGRSPCIDAGDPSQVPNADAPDAAGNPRRSGATVDLGAFEAGPSAVYRFFSPLTLRHFFTISRGERDKLINESMGVWTYEGIAFYASTRPFDDMLPIYRFWSPKQSCHFWTIDEKEAQQMMREQADMWIYEGIAYYAYPPYKQPWGSVPVYRFWWKQRGGHFFTASDEERDKLLKDPAWTYEGTVWYALAGPNGKPTALR